MDIRVKTILDFVQSKTGHEHSVIAGGAVRDETLNLVPRDYDICVPVTREHTINNLLASIHKEFKVEFTDKSSLYPVSTSKKKYAAPTLRATEFTFEGKLIDIISKSYIPNDEKFGSTLVKEFDYGINMAYYDGLAVDDSNTYFKDDIYRHNMTLHNIDNVAALPRAMERYFKFRDKAAVNGMDIRWSCPDLKLGKPKKEKVEVEGEKFQKFYEDDTFVDNVGIEPIRASLPRSATFTSTDRFIRRDRVDDGPTTAAAQGTVTLEDIVRAQRRMDDLAAFGATNPVGEIQITPPIEDNF